MKDMISYFNLTKSLVFITFVIVLLFFNSKKKTHKILLGIVSICFLNELISLIMLLKKIDISLLYTINAIIHNSLWLLLISKFTKNSILFKNIMISYIFFCLFNLFFLEGYKSFNYNAFILGAFMYLILFIYESFFQLKKENFTFFLSNDYVLLFAPVFFFFGLSFIFGFKSHELSSTVIFSNINLYNFIGYSVNTFYYGLISLYIFREKQLKHET